VVAGGRSWGEIDRHRKRPLTPELAAAAGWLAQLHPWQLWVSLAFRREIGRREAWDRLSRWWLREQARNRWRQHFDYVVGWGDQEIGWLHFHLLIHVPCCRGLDLAALAGQWERGPDGRMDGDAPVQRSDRRLLLKRTRYLVRHEGWKLGVACPRRARCHGRRCQQATEPLTGLAGTIL
jgi:hypothetical protein